MPGDWPPLLWRAFLSDHREGVQFSAAKNEGLPTPPPDSFLWANWPGVATSFGARLQLTPPHGTSKYRTIALHSLRGPFLAAGRVGFFLRPRGAEPTYPPENGGFPTPPPASWSTWRVQPGPTSFETNSASTQWGVNHPQVILKELYIYKNTSNWSCQVKRENHGPRSRDWRSLVGSRSPCSGACSSSKSASNQRHIHTNIPSSQTNTRVHIYTHFCSQKMCTF